MTAVAVEDEDDNLDLLPDDLLPKVGPKGKAAPLKRTPKQIAAAQAHAAAQKQADDLRAAQDAAKAQAAMLAQIVNLHIGGYSLADIGLAIGATEQEVDRLLTNETARYVRNQPALRTYVRNWVSGKFMEMIDADWDIAVDKTHAEKLEHQDRVMRMLDRVSKLHGADAPTQTEVKVDTAPEAVERLVSALADNQGLGYDVSVFDTVPGTVVHQAVQQSALALEVSGNAVEESDGDDNL